TADLVNDNADLAQSLLSACLGGGAGLVPDAVRQRSTPARDLLDGRDAGSGRDRGGGRRGHRCVEIAADSVARSRAARGAGSSSIARLAPRTCRLGLARTCPPCRRGIR